MSSGAGAAAGIWSSMPTFRPWRELLDPSALSVPGSLSDATTRLFQNVSHFRSNYAAVVLLILFLRLLTHPAAAAALLLVAAVWALFLLSFPRDEVAGFAVRDGVVLAALGILTVVAVAWAGVAWNVVVSAAIGALVVGSHAVLRSTDDLVSDDRGSPLVGPGDSQGTYSIL